MWNTREHHRLSFVLLSFLIFVILLPVVKSKVAKYTVDVNRNFVAVGKFCGQAKQGASLSFQALNIYSSYNPKLLLYTSDTSNAYFGDVWPDDDNGSDNCFNKSAKAFDGKSFSINLGEDIELPLKSPNNHPIYWWVVIADCQVPSVNMSIDIHWKQVNVSSYYSQFSYEEFDVLTIYIVFFIFWLGITGMTVAAMFLLWKHKRLNLLVRVLACAVFFYCAGLLSELLHYSVYASDGFGLPAFQILGDNFLFLAENLFFIMMFMIARQMVANQFEAAPHITHVLAISGLLILYTALFVWVELYPYLVPEVPSTRFETPPGILMMCTRIIFWAYFAYVIVLHILQKLSLRQIESSWEKITWINILLGFTVWYLYLPFWILACLLMPEYDRTRAYLAMQFSVDLIFYGSTIACLIPHRWNFVLDIMTVEQIDEDEEIVEERLVSNPQAYGALTSSTQPQAS